MKQKNIFLHFAQKSAFAGGRVNRNRTCGNMDASPVYRTSQVIRSYMMLKKTTILVKTISITMYLYENHLQKYNKYGIIYNRVEIGCF